MKTIKTLLKDFLANRRAAKRTEQNQEPEAKSSDQTQSSPAGQADIQESLTLKTNQNETETSETGGVPDMDTPVPEQTSLHVEEPSAIEEAYRRGVIDGRNAQIEERYFPSTDDGVPHFRGTTSPASTFDDIFSMAREA